MNEPTKDGAAAIRRERLLCAIGDALERPATAEQQAEIIAAVEELEIAVAREVLDKRKGSVLRVVALGEIEQTKDVDRRKLTPSRSAEVEAQIAACPTPYYHDTHRYCPSCPWTEE